jgi:type I restriction enzyme S subunit
MTFPMYPTYKKTGIEWPKEAPPHWLPIRLKFAVRLNPSKSEIAKIDRFEEVSFLPMEAIGEDGSISLEHSRPIAEVETGYTYFRDGDVTIAKITPCFENGKGAVMQGLLGGIGFGTTELIVARPINNKVCPEFLHSIFNSDAFRGLGQASMYGAGGQKRVPDDFVRNFRAPIPPLSEQQAVQRFIKRETTKIDALVTEQKRLIELLEEKRQAVISHAVTKGLDQQGAQAVPLLHKHRRHQAW